MFGMNEKEGSWQDGLLKPPGDQWLDEDPEMVKKIPSKEERVASFRVRQLRDTPMRIYLIIIGALPIFLFFDGPTHRWPRSSMYNEIFPIIKVSEAWKAGSVVFFFAILALIFFLGRKEKGHIDVYPEMLVFYDYDPYMEKARPTCFYYWKDVVQYHRKESYLWIHSRDNLPVNTIIPIKKLRPYLRKYAPQAKEAGFYMEDYWKMVAKKNAMKDRTPEEIAIEKEMAANREKAKEVLAGAKDVTAMMEEVEAKRQQEEAAARQKAKDFWNNYPEE